MSEAKEHIPNSFQTPNLYIDQVLELLTGEEWKCLAFAIRHIYGWREKVKTRRGSIARRTFMSGYITKSGKRYGGTGLASGAVERALAGLTKYRVLVPVGVATQDGQEWEIGDDLDLEGLRNRHAARIASNKERTAKATKSRKGASSHETLKKAEGASSHEAQGGTSDETPGSSSDETNQIHIQTHPQTQLKEAPDGASLNADGWVDGWVEVPEPTAYPVTPAEIAELIAVWYEWAVKKPMRRGKVIPLSDHIANKTIREFATTLLSRGASAGDMAELMSEACLFEDSPYAYLAKDAYPFNYCGEVLIKWVEADRDANWYTEDMPRITPRKPGLVLDLKVVLDNRHTYKPGDDVIVEVPRSWLSPAAPEPEDSEPESSPDEDAKLLAELGIEL